MKELFFSRLITTPWNIGPARGRAIIGGMVARLMLGERPERDIGGSPLPVMRVEDGTAIIPLRGVLMLNVPAWVKELGFNVTDGNDIGDEYARALADPAVERIVLDIDSPGGESLCGEKLYDLAAAAGRRKPVFAWAGDGALMCSSAYQAAAPCRAIYAGKFAEVGCVGTYAAVLDDSAYWEQMGIRWEVFRSGPLKGIGIDGITDEQRVYLQGRVEEFGDRFRRGILAYRTGIDPGDLDGRDFRGAEAAARGFVAGLAPSLGAAIARAARV
jgi:ClpP class serine protease